jgi:hypothetical protein
MEVISNEDDGSGVVDTSIIVEFVRYTKQSNKGNDTSGLNATGKIYWSVHHSTPCDFKVNDIVKINGEKYTIIKIVEGRNTKLFSKELYVK